MIRIERPHLIQLYCYNEGGARLYGKIEPHVIQLAGYNKAVDQGSLSELIAKGEATSNPVIRLVA